MPIHPLVLAVSKGLMADALVLLTGKSLPEDVLNAALWAAIKNNHPDLILTLLGHGADINTRFCQQDYNADSTSPLQYAVREGNHALAELLVAQGADLNRPAASHRAPLGEAVMRAIDKNDPAWIDWLLAQCADPNAGKRSATPLALAAMRNRLDLMDRLNAAGAQVQPGDLVPAVKVNALEGAQRLLEWGADPKEKAFSGEYLLSDAISQHNLPMVDLLIRFGATFDRPMKIHSQMQTPSQFSMLWPGHPEITLHLLDRLVEKKPGARGTKTIFLKKGLVLAARNGADLRPWLDAGASPNAADDHGLSALHYASARGNTEAVALLLEKGANAAVSDGYGYRPLHAAALSNKPEVVSLLLATGADPALRVERTLHSGFTALDLAAVEEYKKVAALLAPVSPPQRSFVQSGLAGQKGQHFSYLRFIEDMEAAASGRNIYRREASSIPHWVKPEDASKYPVPCETVATGEADAEYRGTGIPRAEHPLRWRIAFQNCLACSSEDVLVRYARWGVHLMQGDLSWSYEVRCNACGQYSSWGYDEY